MALKGLITKVDGDLWSFKKRYKVGSIVKKGDITYQNLTGINTDPEISSVDWIIIQDDTVFPTNRPIVLVNGNAFMLIKHPSNTSPSEVNNIQNNDFIHDGFFNTTTYWSFAQCIDDTDVNNASSWNVFASLEGLTLI